MLHGYHHNGRPRPVKSPTGLHCLLNTMPVFYAFSNVEIMKMTFFGMFVLLPHSTQYRSAVLCFHWSCLFLLPLEKARLSGQTLHMGLQPQQLWESVTCCCSLALCVWLITLSRLHRRKRFHVTLMLQAFRHERVFSSVCPVGSIHFVILFEFLVKSEDQLSISYCYLFTFFFTLA